MAVRHLPWPINLGGPAKMSASRIMETPKLANLKNWGSQIGSKSVNLILSTSLAIALSLTSGGGVCEALVGVNKPELLPKEFTTVIDVAGFLSAGQYGINVIDDRQSHQIHWIFTLHGHRKLQKTGEVRAEITREITRVLFTLLSNFDHPEQRLGQEIADLEKDTGFKLRILAQNYPDTPGLAIKDFWQVDDRTIVFVVDPTFGNILNFNVGEQVDLDVPRSFWSRLAGKYGNMFYWKEKGEDAAVEVAVNAIGYCLREPVGPTNCSEVK